MPSAPLVAFAFAAGVLTLTCAAHGAWAPAFAVFAQAAVVVAAFRSRS